jgi:hypothetical protein
MATAPDKATFTFFGPDGRLDDSTRFEVPFNPTEYTLNKGVQFAEHPIPGLDSPVLQFVRGQQETLSLTLFFDSTDGGMGEGATPVTESTDRFYRLVKMSGSTHAPPVCRFSWGGGAFPGGFLDAGRAAQRRANGFTCVVESVRQQFTLFSSEGVPLRATLTLTLREYRTLADQLRELNLQSADQTHAHTVREGETLTEVADRHYGDPSEWRRIAEANAIADPLALVPGSILSIPPVVGAR